MTTAHWQAGDPLQLPAAAFTEFVAEIVRLAQARNVPMPPHFFDWANGEGPRLVERRIERSGMLPHLESPSADLWMALRCGVRYWTAPWIVARFPELRPLFPELSVHASGPELSVLMRTGRWRCASGQDCAWRFCEHEVAA